VELSDRTRPDCVAVVELDRPWTPDPADIGHHCMLAQVSCPLDPAGGLLLSNTDRHVGQRNLEVLAGPAERKTMLSILGGQVTTGFTLELTHAGPRHAGCSWQRAVAGSSTPTGNRVTSSSRSWLRSAVGNVPPHRRPGRRVPGHGRLPTSTVRSCPWSR
jgi:hypothetical protein